MKLLSDREIGEGLPETCRPADRHGRLVRIGSYELAEPIPVPSELVRDSCRRVAELNGVHDVLLLRGLPATRVRAVRRATTRRARPTSALNRLAVREESNRSDSTYDRNGAENERRVARRERRENRRGSRPRGRCRRRTASASATSSAASELDRSGTRLARGTRLACSWIDEPGCSIGVGKRVGRISALNARATAERVLPEAEPRERVVKRRIVHGQFLIHLLEITYASPNPAAMLMTPTASGTPHPERASPIVDTVDGPVGAACPNPTGKLVLPGMDGGA